MHKIGVMTEGVIRKENIEEGYRFIKEAGFDCIDFNFDAYLKIGDILSGNINDVFDRPIEEVWADFKPHRECIEKYGLAVGQTHAPFPIMMMGQDEANEKLLRIAINTIELSHRMGSSYIVVHPLTLAFEHSAKEEHDFNIEMYTKLIPAAKKFKQTICLENMFMGIGGHIMEAACSDFRQAVELIDELNEIAGEELFGFCLDVGHANLLGKNLYQAVTRLGHRIKILHLHDNDGVSDLHTIPYTFMRAGGGISTDWDGFLKGMKEIGYKGVLSFETNHCMEVFPLELHASTLKFIADIGRYFSGRIEGR